MRWTYSCPHCGAMLNPGETVVLIARHGETRILIGFHPQPGNYKAYIPPGVELEVGSLWDFHCPVCLDSLTTDQAPGLCALDLHTEGKPHRLFFSRKAGEQATFVITAEGLTERHGRDADHHSLEFFEMV